MDDCRIIAIRQLCVFLSHGAFPGRTLLTFVFCEWMDGIDQARSCSPAIGPPAIRIGKERCQKKESTQLITIAVNV